MSWTDISKTYGLIKPYDFRVAIPLLLNLTGFILVLSVCAFLLADQRLNIGTERFYFFCYLAVLLLISAAFSRMAIPSLLIFFWCVAESSLAVLSDELERRGIANSVFPGNFFTTAADPRFEYHPVLGLVPKPSSHGEWHEDSRNAWVYERSNWPVNSSFFADNNFQHNSLGLRGEELSTSDLKKELIFVYGGSTTYDWTVTQGATWVERLETELDHKFEIVNFGVIIHSTTQHLIHTAFFQNVLKKMPICAVYYVGWNDVTNSHVPNLDPTYANHLSLIMNRFVRRPELWAAKYSPIVRLIDKAARHRFDTIPAIPSLRYAHSLSSPSPNDVRLEQVFVEHIGAITAINNSRGIKSVFVGQILNIDLFQSRPDARSISSFVKNEDTWPMQERLNSILERTSTSLGAKYIDAGIGNFNNNDFSDVGHFSAD